MDHVVKYIRCGRLVQYSMIIYEIALVVSVFLFLFCLFWCRCIASLQLWNYTIPFVRFLIFKTIKKIDLKKHIMCMCLENALRHFLEQLLIPLSSCNH